MAHFVTGAPPPSSRTISGFCREADTNYAPLGCYAASSGNSLPNFPGQKGCPVTTVRNYSLRKAQNSPIISSTQVDYVHMGLNAIGVLKNLPNKGDS